MVDGLAPTGGIKGRGQGRTAEQMLRRNAVGSLK